MLAYLETYRLQTQIEIGLAWSQYAQWGRRPPRAKKNTSSPTPDFSELLHETGLKTVENEIRQWGNQKLRPDEVFKYICQYLL
jgi:hypothetical protein